MKVELKTHRYSKSKTDDILLVQNSSRTRLPACVIFSFGTIDGFSNYLRDTT